MHGRHHAWLLVREAYIDNNNSQKQQQQKACLGLYPDTQHPNGHTTKLSLPEQSEVEVQVEGAQLLTTLVRVPSCVSVAVAPSSQGAAAVGGTPLAQAV